LVYDVPETMRPVSFSSSGGRTFRSPEASVLLLLVVVDILSVLSWAVAVVEAIRRISTVESCFGGTAINSLGRNGSRV